jgi:hypothetical protein
MVSSGWQCGIFSGWPIVERHVIENFATDNLDRAMASLDRTGRTAHRSLLLPRVGAHSCEGGNQQRRLIPTFDALRNSDNLIADGPAHFLGRQIFLGKLFPCSHSTVGYIDDMPPQWAISIPDYVCRLGERECSKLA